MALDPITAALNLLCTEAGQKLLLKLIELNDDILKVCGTLLTKASNHNQ